MTIKWKQELFSEERKHPWILENPETIMTKKRDQDALIATHMNIWQRNTGSQGKIKR